MDSKLYTICSLGDETQFKQLLKSHNYTPDNKCLIIACKYGHHTLIDIILKYKVRRLNYTDAIRTACKNNHLEIAKRLYSSNLTIDIDKFVIRHMCYNNYDNVMKWLLQVQPSIANAIDFTHVEMLCAKNHDKTLEWLLKNHSISLQDIDIDFMNRLIGRNKIDQFNCIFPLCNMCDKDLKQIFVSICKSGNIEIVKLFVELHPKHISSLNDQALFNSFKNQQMEIVFEIIQSSSTKNILARLQHCCKNNYPILFKAIMTMNLEYNISIQDYVLLRLACEHNCYEIINYIHSITYDIDYSIMDEIIIRTACKNNNFEMMQYVVRTNPFTDLTAKDNIMFKTACLNGNLEMCKWLINTDIDIIECIVPDFTYEICIKKELSHITKYLMDIKRNIKV